MHESVKVTRCNDFSMCIQAAGAHHGMPAREPGSQTASRKAWCDNHRPPPWSLKCLVLPGQIWQQIGSGFGILYIYTSFFDDQARRKAQAAIPELIPAIVMAEARRQSHAQVHGVQPLPAAWCYTR